MKCNFLFFIELSDLEYWCLYEIILLSLLHLLAALYLSILTLILRTSIFALWEYPYLLRSAHVVWHHRLVESTIYRLCFSHIVCCITTYLWNELLQAVSSHLLCSLLHLVLYGKNVPLIFISIFLSLIQWRHCFIFFYKVAFLYLRYYWRDTKAMCNLQFVFPCIQ